MQKLRESTLSMYMRGIVRTYYLRGENMDKEKREKINQKKVQEKFNNVTKSVKPENQNQEHNVRREGISKQNNFN